jgi:hypothetical protein
MKPYASLYPRDKSVKTTSDNPSTSKAIRSGEIRGDPVVWKEVQKAMQDGTLDELRNSDPLGTIHKTREREREHERKNTKKKYKEGRSESHTMRRPQDISKTASDHHEEDDSDGGFFE